MFVILCYVMVCYVMFVILCYVMFMLYYVVMLCLCYIMWCYVMLCDVMNKIFCVLTMRALSRVLCFCLSPYTVCYFGYVSALYLTGHWFCACLTLRSYALLFKCTERARPSPLLKQLNGADWLLFDRSVVFVVQMCHSIEDKWMRTVKLCEESV
jgi:hypothetical protein